MEFENWASSQLNGLNDGSLVAKPFPSESVFKFVGLNTKTSWSYFEETLRANVLKGSTASALNDPFELQPSIIDDIDANVVERGLKLVSWKPGELESWDFSDLDKPRALAKQYIKQIHEYFRIVSFSDRFDSPLLWSHYANSYQGACFHFLAGAFDGLRGAPLHKVQYTRSRPIYPLSLALAIKLNERKSDDRVSALRRQSDRLFFYQKADDWSYEGESRIAYNANRRSEVTFDPSKLVAIILGPRMAEADRSRVKDLASRYLPQLTIREARLSSSTFAVDVSG